MKLWIYSAIVLGLAGCGNSDKAAAPPVEVEKTAQVVPPKSVKDHNYSLRDGLEYGYESAVSDNDKNNGQVASKLSMFRYVGTRDGKYQVYSKEDSVITVAECDNPCEFMKVMVFSDGTHFKTERMRATEGSLGWYVMQDAINGKMDQAIWVSNDRKVKKDIWFSEKKGMQFIHQKAPA